MPRFQLDLTQDNLEQIQLLMETCGVSSKKEFINNSISLLTWAVRKIEQGAQIGAINEADGTFMEITMPILENVKFSTR